MILGTIRDFITDEVREETHDEQYRQKIARFLVDEKGYRKTDIKPHNLLIVAAGERRGRLWVDFVVGLDDRTMMLIKYGPGSLVTRYRPTLAISRLVAPYQIPVVVVTNGEDADVLDGETGRLIASGFERIPSREDLLSQLTTAPFTPIPAKRAEMEGRIVYAFEIDGGCPCDDTACRIA
ncbi:hypothetical protein JCM12296A_09640 [Desulfosarcina cetonica]